MIHDGDTCFEYFLEPLAGGGFLWRILEAATYVERGNVGGGGMVCRWRCRCVDGRYQIPKGRSEVEKRCRGKREQQMSVGTSKSV